MNIHDLVRWALEAQGYREREKKTQKTVFRRGKTDRDRHQGVLAQNESNKMERAEWSRNGGTFPSHTCNGKRNRRLVTIGKGQQAHPND